jgi:anti-anti-sigma regulatory factor
MLTRRQVVAALMVVQIAGALLIIAGQAMLDPGGTAVIVGGVVAAVSAGVLLAAYLRGWEPARYLDAVLLTLVVGLATPEPYVTQFSALIVLVPPALTLILADAPWVVGLALAELVIFTLRSGPAGGYITAYTNDLRTLVTYAMVVVALYLSRLVADAAQRSAEASAARAERALADAARQAAQNEEQAQALAAQNEEQRRLLELVATLETPAVQIAEGVLLAPLVGRLDARRAAALTERLLRAAHERRARLVILDVAGASDMDGAAAEALVQAAQALRLIGCRAAITGIAAPVAALLAGGDGSLADVIAAPTPQEALARYGDSG